VLETSSLSADNVLGGSVDYCLDYLEKHGKLENLYENARRWPNPLPASCACSGSGAWAWVVDAWTNYLSDRLAIALNATHVFTCDIKGNRQWWLMNSKLTGDRYCCCFGDVRSLGKERAACSKRKMDGGCLVPWSAAHACGFSCASESSFNNSAVANRMNLAKGEKGSATADTWAGDLSYLDARHPLFVVSENVEAYPHAHVLATGSVDCTEYAQIFLGGSFRIIRMMGLY
jgi:hypothetical protein